MCVKSDVLSTRRSLWASTIIVVSVVKWYYYRCCRPDGRSGKGVPLLRHASHYVWMYGPSDSWILCSAYNFLSDGGRASLAIGPRNLHDLINMFINSSINHSHCLSAARIRFGACCDWSAFHTPALAHINPAAQCHLFRLEQTTLCHRQREREAKIMLQTMDRMSCLSWCAAAGWGMTVSWQSILSALTTKSPDLCGYDSSRQLNKHVALANPQSLRPLATHIEAWTTNDLFRLAWKLPMFSSLPTTGHYPHPYHQTTLLKGAVCRIWRHILAASEHEPAPSRFSLLLLVSIFFCHTCLHILVLIFSSCAL